MLVAVGTDRVHFSGSCWAATRMNLSQPSAARIRRARLGALGRGSGGVYVRPLAPRFLWGSPEVVTRSLLSVGSRPESLSTSERRVTSERRSVTFSQSGPRAILGLFPGVGAWRV